MPIYTLKDNKTGDLWEVNCSYSDLKIMLDELPNVSQVLSAPKIIGGVKGVHSQTSDAWKDTLREIKKNSGKGNTIKI